MPTDEILGCAVCSASMSYVGVMYNGVKVVRILACENGHFIQATTPQELQSWLNLSAMGKFSVKLYESDILPSDLQELWIRNGDAWTRTKIKDPVADIANLGNVRSCPFCHSTHTLVMRDSKNYFLCCGDCEVYGPEAVELHNAIDKWNSA